MSKDLQKQDIEEYEDALLLELMRYAELERDDWDMTDEFDLAIRSVWYLLNPMGVKGREKIDITYGKYSSDNISPYERHCRFTSHAHHNEPLKPSPEDLLIYRSYRSNKRDSCHIITDRFNLIEIEDWD